MTPDRYREDKGKGASTHDSTAYSTTDPTAEILAEISTDMSTDGSTDGSAEELLGSTPRAPSVLDSGAAEEGRAGVNMGANGRAAVGAEQAPSLSARTAIKPDAAVAYGT